MQELELKVELSRSDVKRLEGELRCDKLASQSPATPKRLRTVYFDTPRHNLHAVGLSLRVTRQDGHWLQTIKADQRAADGTSHAVEMQSPVATREPDLAKITDKKVRRALHRAVRGTSLHPVFETVLQRTSREAQGSKIALAVDGGAERAEGATEVRETGLEGNVRSFV
jgi:inorganic triphosphatase YgiF